MTLDRLALRAARRKAVMVFAIITFALLAAGFWYYRQGMERIVQEKHAFLASIGERKAGQIELWRKERAGDARRLAKGPYIKQTIAGFLGDPVRSTNRAGLMERLALEQTEGNYHDVLLLATDGRLLLTTETNPASLSPATQRAVAAALASANAVMSDIFREPDGVIHVDVVAAVRDAEENPLAMVVLRSHASDFLYPLIQSWPVPSRTAETVLAQRDGEEVVFLNELRHQTNTALTLRFPLTRTDVPAVQAVLGSQGRFEGMDYRGIEALSDVRPVPDSPWFIVAKIDTAELSAEIRYRTASIAGIVASLILLAAAVAAFLYRRWQAREFRDLYESERRRGEVERMFRATLYSIGDAVIATDTNGAVQHMNPVAERLTGWTELEARGRPLDEVFRIINETTRLSAVNPVDNVLRSGAVIPLANHTLLIARDGSERPIADSAAPIRAAEGKITGVVLVFSDQTTQHAARRALTVSEERLRLALAAADQGLYDLNVQTGECVVSPEYARMLDYEPAEFRETNAAWRERLHPDDREPVYRAYEEYVEGRSDEYRVEFRQRTRDGNWKWILSLGKLVSRSADGRPLRMLGTHKDITGRKQAERRVAEALSYNRTILEHSPAGIITYTADGDTVSANAAAARILGATVEQLQAQNFRRIESWQGSGLLATAGRTLQTGQEQALEAHLVSTFGQEVWLACHFAPFSHEGRPQLVLMFSDITESKRAQERLRLQSSALDAAANAIVITNRDGQIEWVNPAFTTITGYSNAEAMGRLPGELLKSGKHDQAFYQAMWETILAGNVWRGEVINRRKDGTVYPEEMTVTPLKDEHGSITHFIAVKQDVTQRKALEEQFRQAHKMEAIGQLAGGVAHDFNNMLAVILGNATLIEMGLSTEEQQHALQEISRAAERATSLTRQLLTFSRRQTLQAQPLDLNDIVSGMVKMLHRIIGEDITLQTRLLSDGAPVHGDPGMLEQVLLNLAVNARDAMLNGGEIAVTLAQATFGNTTALQPPAQPGDFIRLSVRDTGNGIAPEHLPRIFEPFFTTKDVGKGTGLGLATVHGIVEQHHGWIEVESSPGAGATFHIYLPRLAVAAQAPAGSPNSKIVPGGDETILLVEDEMALRLLATRALERYGYRVIEAANGVEARRAWEQHKHTVDLLLTDIIMPEGVSGRQLAEELCAERPELKVIYMSGYPGEVAGRGLNLREGVNYLKKPFGLIPLAEVLRRCLDESLQHPV